ncbi:MAG: alpha/beta hydrolase [Ignavibacteriales bacterium]|nr:alpha/beta hydrolase [Ignavibacteriales bacterium]
MKKNIKIKIVDSGLWFDTDIAFAQVPYWFNHTTKNLKLSLIRHFESERKSLPLIIWICGGAWYSMDINAHLPNLVEIAKKGYVIATIEYRNSNEAKFPSQIEDVKAAIRFLRANAENYKIDHRNIGIMGESAGGYLASFVGTTNEKPEFDKGLYLNYSSKVQAVCSWYAPIDLNVKKHLGQTHEKLKKITPEELFLSDTTSINSSLFVKANPITYLSKKTPPFLLFHGLKDTTVPIYQSEIFYDALKSRSIPADLYIIEDAGHASVEFFQPQIKSLIVDFFDRYLK